MRKEPISVAINARDNILGLVLIVTFGFGTVMAQTGKSTAVKNIVVVHGAFASW